MTGTTAGVRRRAPLLVVAVLGAVAVLLTLTSTAAARPDGGRATVTITVNTLPIANALPMDLGISKGFFEAQGIQINKRTLQSGNDVVLSVAAGNGEIGYLGFVPMFIGRTQGIPFTARVGQRGRGHERAEQLAEHPRQGVELDPQPRRPRREDDRRQRPEGRRRGDDQGRAAEGRRQPELGAPAGAAVPRDAVGAAERPGRRDLDARAVPVARDQRRRRAHGDGARPGARRLLADRRLRRARRPGSRRNPGLARRFRTAINQSLAYAQAHPDEVRALLPAAQRTVRLPIWTTLVDRQKVAQLARYTKQYGVIETLPNLAALIPSVIPGGKTLQGSVGNRFILLRQDGRPVTRLAVGQYTFVVSDTSRTQNFRLVGPGVNKQTSVRGIGRATWQLRLRRGTYTFSSSARASLKRTFVVR